MDKPIKDFVENWFFGYEKRQTPSMKDIGKDRPFEEVLSEHWGAVGTSAQRALEVFSEFVENIKAIKKYLTTRTIPANRASEIHGLTNRQIVNWEKLGLMPFEKIEGKRRVYSPVDIAWIVILRQFQMGKNSPVRAFADVFRSIFLAEDALALCLTRDFFPSSNLVLVMRPEGNKICFSSQLELLISKHSKSDIIPIANIMESIIIEAGIAGFMTFVADGKRYFKTERSQESFYLFETLRDLYIGGFFSAIDSYLGTSNIGERGLVVDSLNPIPWLTEKELNAHIRKEDKSIPSK